MRTRYSRSSATGIEAECQVPLTVNYKGKPAGQFVADMVVEQRVTIELKAAARLMPEHEAQILNCLTASRFRVGLLVNFTRPKAQVKRFVV